MAKSNSVHFYVDLVWRTLYSLLKSSSKIQLKRSAAYSFESSLNATKCLRGFELKGTGGREYSLGLFLESNTLACYYVSNSSHLILNIIVIIKRHLNLETQVYRASAILPYTYSLICIPK